MNMGSRLGKTSVMRFLAYSVLLALALLVSGCVATQHHRAPLHYDASNPLKRVAVLPLRNDTADVDGPNVVRKKMFQAFINKAYTVQDMKVTDQILRDRMGITLGGQLEMTTAKELGETLEVDGVLYGILVDFTELTTGAYNVKKVRADFKLVHAITGETVWQQGLGVRSEIIMEGDAGVAAAVTARSVDARDKDIPWITIQTITTGTKNYGESLAIGLGSKLLAEAVGLHLERESTELARRVTSNLRWGPGPASAPTPLVMPPHETIPK